MNHFRDTHIIAFLKKWEASSSPLDLALSNYFRSHKSLGAHDRREIGQTIYTFVRWKSLFSWLDPSASFAKQLFLLRKKPIEEWIQEENIPEAVKFGLSEFLFEELVQAYGLEQTRKIADVLNSQAPVSVRANLLKTSREELLNLWKSTFEVRPALNTSAGILFAKREPLFSLPAFKEGLFEMQDIGSQLIADLVEIKPKERLLDYCSGSGGKSLAIAPKMNRTGEIYLHDIREQSLLEAKKRLRRAGVQNGQILSTNHPTLPKLKGKMDWVLADVPCSGTGTLRRNPDMKWKIDSSMIDRLIQEQRMILQKAVQFVKSGGKLVYATCSILPKENQAQVDWLLASFPFVLEKTPLSILPEHGGHDGFFAAVFKKSETE